MYYGNNKHYIEPHDDAEVKEAHLVETEAGAHELHVKYTLKPHVDTSDIRFMHSTNGVDHRLSPVAPAAPEVKESKKK